MRAADNVASIAAGLPRPLAVLWAEGLAEAAQLRAPERAAIRLQGQFLRWTLLLLVVSLPEHHPASVRGSGPHPLWSGRKLVDGTMLDHIHQLLKDGQFRPYTPGADIRAWYLDPRLNVAARLRHLVAVRNRHAHADSSLRGAEREAAKWLAECLRIVAEATWLRSWILFRLVSQLPSVSRVKATWRCEPLRGPGLATEFPTLSLSGQGAAGEVFVRSPDGLTIAPLAPFVLWEDGRLLTPSGFRTDRRINHVDPMRDAEGPEIVASPRQTHFALEPIAVVQEGPVPRAPISLVTLDAYLSPVPVAPLQAVAPSHSRHRPRNPSPRPEPRRAVEATQAPPPGPARSSSPAPAVPPAQAVLPASDVQPSSTAHPVVDPRAHATPAVVSRAPTEAGSQPDAFSFEDDEPPPRRDLSRREEDVVRMAPQRRRWLWVAVTLVIGFGVATAAYMATMAWLRHDLAAVSSLNPSPVSR